MTDKKFSEFVAKSTPLSNDEVVGFSGSDNIRIPVSSLTNAAGALPIVVDSTSITPAISINAATTSLPGSMSAGDKTKVDGLVSIPFPNKPAGEPIVIIALGNSDIISQQGATSPLNANSKRLSWNNVDEAWETVDMTSTTAASGWLPPPAAAQFFVGYTGGSVQSDGVARAHGNLPLATADYLSDLTGTNCYVIQAGKGGTPIEQYGPYSAFEAFFSGAINTALPLIPDSNGDLGNITKADIFIFGHQAGAKDYKVAKYSEQFLRLYNFWISTRGYIDLETTQVLLTEMYDGRTGIHGNPNDWKASEQTMTQTNGNVKIVSSRGLGSSDGLHISGNDLTKFGARCGQTAMQPNAPKIEVPAGSPRRVLNTVPLAGQWTLAADNNAAPTTGTFRFKADGLTLQIHKTDNATPSATPALEWISVKDTLSFTDESAIAAIMAVTAVTEQTNHWEFLTSNSTQMKTLTVGEDCDLLGNTGIPSGEFDDYLVAPRGGRVIVGELDPTAIPNSAYGAQDYKTVTASLDLAALVENGVSYTYTNNLTSNPFTHERTFWDFTAYGGGQVTYEKHSHRLVTQVGKSIPSTNSNKGKFSMEIALDASKALQETYSVLATSETGSQFRVNSLKLNAPLDLGRSASSRALIGTTDTGGLQWEKEDEYIHYATAETTGTAAVTMYSRAVNSYGLIGTRPCLVKFDVVGHRFYENGNTTGAYYTCTKQAIISWNGTDPVLSPVTVISEIRTGVNTANASFSTNSVTNTFQINVQESGADAAEDWKWKCVVYREVLPESHSGT